MLHVCSRNQKWFSCSVSGFTILECTWQCAGAKCKFCYQQDDCNEVQNLVQLFCIQRWALISGSRFTTVLITMVKGDVLHVGPKSKICNYVEIWPSNGTRSHQTCHLSVYALPEEACVHGFSNAMLSSCLCALWNAIVGPYSE